MADRRNNKNVLAMNLYNGFMYNCTIWDDLEPDTEGDFTPYELFAKQDAFYMLESVKVRCPQYTMMQESQEE
ncbi:MAG: DUF6075 family protein [bacterium]|nr:DUF6075 family protein [bacterium]